MQIAEPKCSKRDCKHFIGIKFDDVHEKATLYCEAFPNGIPRNIAYGSDKHLKPHKGQTNSTVYEEKSNAQ